MSQASPQYLQLDFTPKNMYYSSLPDPELQAEITTKQTEILELKAKLTALDNSTEPEFTPSSISEQIEAELQKQTQDSDRTEIAQAIQTVLNRVEHELNTLNYISASRNTERAKATAIKELDSIVDAYNIAAVEYSHKVMELREIAQKTYPVLKQAGLFPTLVNPDSQIEFAVNHGNGIIHFSSKWRLTSEQRSQLGL